MIWVNLLPIEDVAKHGVRLSVHGLIALKLDSKNKNSIVFVAQPVEIQPTEPYQGLPDFHASRAFCKQMFDVLNRIFVAS